MIDRMFIYTFNINILYLNTRLDGYKKFTLKAVTKMVTIVP